MVIELLINIRQSVKMTLFQQKNHVIKQIDTNSQITQIVNHFTENSCLLDITIQTDEPEKNLRFRTSEQNKSQWSFLFHIVQKLWDIFAI